MKTVLITGASRGIGAACTIKFAENNYNVVINYKCDKEKATKLAKELTNKYGVEVLVVKANIAKEAEVKDMFAKIKDKFKKIDVVVNNAGIAIDNDYLEKTSSEFRQVIETNLLGTFLVSKYASLLMDEGCIINVSSNCATEASYPEGMDYNASKAGVITLTKDFAKRLAPKIRVNAVLPGWIDTDMNKDIEPEFKKKEIDKILLNRFGTKEEVADVIFFLTTASYINGSLISVDGGLK